MEEYLHRTKSNICKPTVVQSVDLFQKAIEKMNKNALS